MLNFCMFLTEDFFINSLILITSIHSIKDLNTEVCGLFQSASKQCLGTVYADRRDTVQVPYYLCEYFIPIFC